MRQSAAPISMTATRRRFVQAALHFSPQTLNCCPRGQTPRPRGRQTPCTLIAETSGEADYPGPPDARRRPSFANAPEPVRGPGGPDASPPPPPSNARALRGRQAFSSTNHGHPGSQSGSKRVGVKMKNARITARQHCAGASSHGSSRCAVTRRAHVRSFQRSCVHGQVGTFYGAHS